MSGLPPINLHGDKALPAIYRRSDITRQATIPGKQPLPKPSGGLLIDLSNNGYSRLRKDCTASAEPGTFYRKGMIIDVWT